MRVFGVQLPLQGVVADILADFLQFGFAAEDVLVMVALPDRNFRVIQKVMRQVWTPPPVDV